MFSIIEKIKSLLKLNIRKPKKYPYWMMIIKDEESKTLNLYDLL